MGTGVPLEQAAQIMLNHRTILATLLKQEAGDGGLHQPVLIPLGVLLDEHPHGAMQILRHLVFHTHVDWHRIGRLVQLKPSLSTTPSRHDTCGDVKKPDSLRLACSRIRKKLSSTGFSCHTCVMEYSAKLFLLFPSRGKLLFPWRQTEASSGRRSARTGLWKSCEKRCVWRGVAVCSPLLINSAQPTSKSHHPQLANAHCLPTAPHNHRRPYEKQVGSAKRNHLTLQRTLALTLTATTLLVGCGKPKTQAKKLLTVKTASIAEANFQPSIEAISVLESTTTVSLRPETDGRVVKVLASDGERVKAGQPILELDNVQQSAALDSAQAQARTDKLNAERYEFLYQNGAASAKQRDQYVTQAIASRDQARSDAATLGYKFVRSPIDGVVGDLDSVKLGDYVQTGQAITGIVNNSTLWTLMQIPATQSGAVKIGQTVKVASQTNPPITGEGKVSFISPYFGVSGSNSSPNALMVKATFPNLTNQLKTGQFVKSQIIVGNKQALAVPVQAVFMQAQQPFVYVTIPVSKALPKIKASASVPEKQKKKLESLPPSTPIVVQQAVELGELQNNFYPLKSGLKKGDTVVVSKTALLSNGIPVKTTN